MFSKFFIEKSKQHYFHEIIYISLNFYYNIYIYEEYIKTIFFKGTSNNKMNLNFGYTASFVKSGKENENKIPITIIPNAPIRDRQNDLIVIKAFADDECKRNFLHDGVIDYDHLSVLGADPLIRSKAIIGQPENVYIDEAKNLPIVEAFLFKNNPFVKDCILPALESGSKVFGASVGGKIIQKSMDIDPITKKEIGNRITKIRMNHIAITPLQKAVNQSTSVSLRKSADGSEEEEIYFNDFDDLVKSIQSGEILEKALEAGVSTDISKITGGQTLQGQSLEGVNKKKLNAVMPFVLEAILNGQLKGGYKEYKNYLVSRGFNPKEAEEMMLLLAKNGAKIVKLIF